MADKDNYLKHKLNLDIIDLTNLSTYEGDYELPNVTCNGDISSIDYLALFSRTDDYKGKGDRAVCFYEYDATFDGMHGLFNAIYYGDKKLLNKFEERFRDVEIFIAPDYSLVDDVPFVENLYRIYKARLVSLYMINKWDKIVIPNISFVNEDTKKACFNGIDKGSIVAISAKGCLKAKEQKQLFEEMVEETIKRISPSTIVIYNVAIKSDFLNEQITKLEANGSRVFLPNNNLLERNRILQGGKING